MKLVDIDSLPSQDWLMLGLHRLDAPYRAVLVGKVDLAIMEAYCAGIRFALFEFSANSRRCPGRFDDTARALIVMTDRVLRVAQEARTSQMDEAKWARVISAITSHRDQLEMRLRESSRAQKEILAKRKRETQRLFGSRRALLSLHPIG